MPRGDGTGPLGKGPGTGRGLGRGGGAGGGRGSGQGMGIGRKSFSVPSTPSQQPVQDEPQKISKEQEMQMLSEQAKALQQELQRVEKQMEELSKTSQSSKTKFVVVDESICNGCVICEGVCPEGAIVVDEKAHIDKVKCTGCGICIENCPVEAISFS